MPSNLTLSLTAAVAVCLAATSPLRAQVARSHDAQPILNRSRPMIEPNTVDVALQPPRGRIESESIRPFHIHIPHERLTELRRRIRATQWPEKETVADQSQGVPLATMQELSRYWGTEYDWRKVEAKLNALPQFITNIDGLDIHFIHVRSKHANALPLIINHGWPGSIIEQLKLIEWRRARRPSTASPIHRSASPPGSSTTTTPTGSRPQRFSPR